MASYPKKTINTVLIAGGTGGIGTETIKVFAKNNAKNIYFTYFNNKSLAQHIEQDTSNKYQINCKGFNVDLSNINQIRFVENLLSHESDTVDVLVNCVAIVRNNFWVFLSDEEWDSVLNTNLKGAFNLIKVFTKRMMKNRFGRIINISSVAGTLGSIRQVNYSASKAGIIGLTKTAALEFSSYNIKTLAVLPGIIETKLTDSYSEQEKSKILSTVPMNRLGTANEVADLIYALSIDFLKLSNGSCITIDGGLSLNYEN